MLRCIDCRNHYPVDHTPYRCNRCAGLWDFDWDKPFDLADLDETLPGIWRYRGLFDYKGKSDSLPVSLGEGNTPLVWSEAFGQQAAFKLEFLNPTGSFKDRGTALTAAFLRSRGITRAVEDSSGNAGASFAAYAAAAGIKAKIYVPAYASGPKRNQISAYGAEVIQVPGPRSKTSEAVEAAAAQGAVYASHAYLPHGGLGYATIAFELLEQLGTMPGTVVAPVGQGSLLLGIGRGFRQLQLTGIIKARPVLIGVQAAACAPYYSAFSTHKLTIDEVAENETLAEGVRVRRPLRGGALIETVQASKGCFVAVREKEILPGRDELANRGLFVEPTSAIVWNGLAQIISQVPTPIVVILTGSGLKSTL